MQMRDQNIEAWVVILYEALEGHTLRGHNIILYFIFLIGSRTHYLCSYDFV